jgi:Transcription regulator of the Arc/MetJ class
VAKTLIDIDESLLTTVQRILDTTTKKDTVNGALREIARRWAAVRFLELARGGVFEAGAGVRRVDPSC